jgi:hypothetical protein
MYVGLLYFDPERISRSHVQGITEEGPPIGHQGWSGHSIMMRFGSTHELSETSQDEERSGRSDR